MKIGIMSDNHGRLRPVRRALELLEAGGADGIIHCGDTGGISTLELLAGRRGWFVWGNTDFPEPTWRTAVQALDLPWPDGSLKLTLDGKHIAVFHGHEPAFSEMLEKADCDYLLHGHTHRAFDYYNDKMRIINPGALHRVSVKTVALLDLRTDTVEFIEIDA
ncbi:MAG: YfcE family phosphodiesterase [Phycisphaerales bacterium]|nr:YfcE family phosphodiesterase [Phycisphaerales bacterium]